MAAAILAPLGEQMVSSLLSGLFQKGNGNTNSYRQGVRDGVFFDEM